MLKRDRAFVAEKYEQIWGGVRDFVAAARAAGEADFETLFRRALEHTNGVADAQSGAQPVEFTFHGVEIGIPAMAREYVWRDLITQEVLAATRPDADVIAELGSGWSANLFNLWLRGAPRGALYVGGEFARGGQEAGAALAATLPRMKYAAVPFDWSFPDFGFLPPHARHVTVYSCYSIEQVPQLDAKCIRQLLERTAAAETVRGVFIEPVGFQFPEYCPNPALVEPSRAYALEKNYNLNLRQVLEALAQESRIRILGAAFDAFGNKVNPATIIHWQRA